MLALAISPVCAQKKEEKPAQDFFVAAFPKVAGLGSISAGVSAYEGQSITGTSAMFVLEATNVIYNTLCERRAKVIGIFHEK